MNTKTRISRIFVRQSLSIYTMNTSTQPISYVNPFTRCKKFRDLYTQEILKEVIELFHIHNTVKRVSILTGRQEDTVKKILLANGITPPNKEQSYYRRASLSEEILEPTNQQKIVEQYKSKIKLTTIAEQYGVSIDVIRTIVRKHGVRSSIPVYTPTLEANKEAILKLYKEEKSFIEIGTLYKCSSRSVALFIRKCTNEQPRKKSINPIPIEDIEKINKLHNERGMTMGEIGKLYGCTFPCVGDFFDKHNIPRRSKSEAIRLKNHDEENMQKKIRNMLKKKEIILPSGKVVKVQGYEDSFLKFVFDNNLLNEEDIDFKPKIIPYVQNNIQRKYIPDFFIPKFNAIVEVKSTWILNKQGKDTTICKQKAVEAEGYKFCLVLDNNFDSFLALLNDK